MLEIGRGYPMPRREVLAMVEQQNGDEIEVTGTPEDWIQAIYRAWEGSSEGVRSVIRERVFVWLPSKATWSIKELKYHLHNPPGRELRGPEDVPEETMQQAEKMLEDAADALSSEEG